MVDVFINLMDFIFSIKKLLQEDKKMYEIFCFCRQMTNT